MNVYEYLTKEYVPGEPIFIKNISIPGVEQGYVRKQIKDLTDKDFIRRFDAGIYYIPDRTYFTSGAPLSADAVIKKKFINNGTQYYGYVSGMLFANQIGITTQVPMLYEVVSNTATKDYREIEIKNTRVIIRRPRTDINSDNYKVLQFLDLVKDIDSFSEIGGQFLNNIISEYLKKIEIDFLNLEPYLDYYPDKIYKNLYSIGVLNGISSSK